MKRAALLGFVVLLTTSSTVAVGWGREDSKTSNDRVGQSARAALPALPQKPDIYYIILDRYGGPGPLKRDFHFDNRPLLNWLRSKGFYVADRARTNYPKTSVSVASTLDMRFIDLKAPSKPKDPSAIFIKLKRTRVARFLKGKGYRYIKLGSWWPPTATDPVADKNLTFHRPASLNAYAARHGLTSKERFLATEYLHRFWQYRQLREVIPKMKGPKFVWAHILCPHEPWVIDRNGDFTSQSTNARGYFRRSHGIHPIRKMNYLEQLMWSNTQLKNLATALLQGPENTRPVIAIEADEGPYSGLVPSRVKGASIRKLKQKMYVLNAIYLPGVRKPPLYPNFTNVNTFRIIFNLYLGTKYSLLPDKSFVFTDNSVYDFLDVTDLVKN
jgi:hypothetical protein